MIGALNQKMFAMVIGRLEIVGPGNWDIESENVGPGNWDTESENVGHGNWDTESENVAMVIGTLNHW